MSSPALDVERLPALCHLNYCGDEADAATKFYFYLYGQLAGKLGVSTVIGLQSEWR